MNVKVCGITSVAALQHLQEMGVDYAGMIFYPKSTRYAGAVLQNDKEAIRELAIKKIGVFVNEPLEHVHKCIEDFGLYAVQLHGDETPAYCKSLMPFTKVIKVFRISGADEVQTFLNPFSDACHYYLFDTDTNTYGGSGKQFNWKILEGANIQKPFFLSGGIGLDDAEKLQAFHHPCLHAVDVNSRFEISPGVKDMQQVQALLHDLNKKTIHTTKAK